MTDKELIEKCLLTREEIDEATFGKEGYDFNIAHAQLAKAIPIIREAVEEECLQDKIEYGESTYESGYAMAEKEVAKEFIEWGEEICTDHFKDVHRVGGPKRCRCTECWQALKEER